MDAAPRSTPPASAGAAARRQSRRPKAHALTFGSRACARAASSAARFSSPRLRAHQAAAQPPDGLLGADREGALEVLEGALALRRRLAVQRPAERRPGSRPPRARARRRAPGTRAPRESCRRASGVAAHVRGLGLRDAIRIGGRACRRASPRSARAARVGEHLVRARDLGEHLVGRLLRGRAARAARDDRDGGASRRCR